MHCAAQGTVWAKVLYGGGGGGYREPTQVAHRMPHTTLAPTARFTFCAHESVTREDPPLGGAAQSRAMAQISHLRSNSI